MADTNTESTAAESGSGSTLADIVNGVKDMMGDSTAAKAAAEKAGAEEVKAAQQDEAKMEAAGEKAESTLESYTDNIARLRSSVSSFRSTAQSMGLKAKEANAENQVAQITASQGVVGVAQVLELMEAEKQAKQAKAKAEAEHLKAAFSYVGAALSDGAKLVFETAKVDDQLLDGTSASGTGFASSVAALAGGAAVGMLLGGDESPIQDAAVGKVESFVALQEGNEIGEGVEEKVLDGLDEEGFAEYAAENANGEPDDPYADANDGAEEYSGAAKLIESAVQAVTVPTADALTAPIESMDLDELIADGRNQPQEDASGLAMSVAEGAAPEADKPEQQADPAGNYSPLMQQLMAQQAAQAQQGPEDDIPDVPDFAD